MESILNSVEIENEVNYPSVKKNVRMKSRHSQNMIQLIADIIAVVSSYLLFYYIRFEAGLFSTNIKPGMAEVWLGTIFFSIFWLIVFFFTGMYKNWYERSPFDEIWSILRVTLIGCALIVFAVMFDSQTSPRKLYLIYTFFISFSVITGRTIARNFEKKLRRQRILYIPAIIVGTKKRASDFYIKTEFSTSWGYKTVGVVLCDYNELEIAKKSNSGISDKILGTVDNLDKILDDIQPEEVIISSDNTNHDILLEIVASCSDRSIRVKIEPDLYDIFTGQAKTQNLYGIPLIEISTQLMKPWQEVLKRIFDIAFSSFILVVGLPFWFIVGVLIKFDSFGPMFYTQPRVGKDGRIFKIFKFRSMRHEPIQTDEQWTLVNDPRVTKFGKFIRKTHLDEIPQFWNVLIGDMSVVGPRPEQPKFVEDFTKAIPHYRRRLKVRPGITGWWQVKSQSYQLNLDEISFRLKDDFYYIENMSIKLDFEIVVRTVWCVIIGHGQA
jgi:exopolysaccharide biosynthesis polyprenyl glycosylphosphotransferase